MEYVVPRPFPFRLMYPLVWRVFRARMVFDLLQSSLSAISLLESLMPSDNNAHTWPQPYRIVLAQISKTKMQRKYFRRIFISDIEYLPI